MSGNAMEEGLILQIHNPSHTDPSRVGFLAGALSGFAAIVISTLVLPNLPRLLAIYLALSVAAAIGTLVTQRITDKRTRRQVARLIAARTRHRAETTRQIAEMNMAAISSGP